MRVWKGRGKQLQKAQSVPWARVSACLAGSGSSQGSATQLPDRVGMSTVVVPVLSLGPDKARVWQFSSFAQGSLLRQSLKAVGSC